MIEIPRHVSVFAGKLAALLQLHSGKTFLDCTLGDGGHTQEALKAGCRVISVDVDQASIDRATKFIGTEFSPIIATPSQLSMVPKDTPWLILKTNFGELNKLFAEHHLSKVDALWADLGTSQYHVADPERGFSFLLAGPLDMRLDSSLGVTAADLVNVLPAKQLADLLYSVEETYAGPISRAIVAARNQKAFSQTQELANLVSRVKPKQGKTHPATKTFMALRMAVNMELDVLSSLLDSIPSLVKSTGLAGVISFHSGEDRLVKQTFKRLEAEEKIRVINDKPIEPDQNEIINNNKIRSAKLRLIQIL